MAKSCLATLAGDDPFAADRIDPGLIHWATWATPTTPLPRPPALGPPRASSAELGPPGAGIAPPEDRPWVRTAPGVEEGRGVVRASARVLLSGAEWASAKGGGTPFCLTI